MSHFLGANRSISTYRLANAVSPDDTTEYSAVAEFSGIEAYVESTKPELDLVLGVKPGLEAYMMYVDAEELNDVRVSDKVVDNLGDVYFVQGIKRHIENDDTENHLEIFMLKETTRYTD